MSSLRTLQADVQTGLQSVRSDLQSLSDHLQKVEEGESQSQTPSPSPRPAQRASADVLPSLPSSSRSWADRVEQEEDGDAFEHWMDLDVTEPGDDAKGIRIFPLHDATRSFLSQALSSPLPSQVRRQLRERFGKPNLPNATTPQLDNVMRPLMSSQAKGRDKELAKIQTFCFDAFAPLARYINKANSDSGQLSAADYLEMVRTSARLLGNLSVLCSRLRRSSVLQSVNSRIVDMADEDEIFHDAGRKPFGEGFTKKAKERDDELRSLAAQQLGDRRKPPTSRPFFPGSQATTGNSAKASKPTEGSHVLDPTTTLRRRRRTTH